MAVEDEQIGAGVLHEILAEIVDQKGDGGGLAAAAFDGRERDGMPALVVEEHLQTPTGVAGRQPGSVIARRRDVRGCWGGGWGRARGCEMPKDGNMKSEK